MPSLDLIAFFAFVCSPGWAVIWRDSDVYRRKAVWRFNNWRIQKYLEINRLLERFGRILTARIGNILNFNHFCDLGAMDGRRFPFVMNFDPTTWRPFVSHPSNKAFQSANPMNRIMCSVNSLLQVFPPPCPFSNGFFVRQSRIKSAISCYSSYKTKYK